MPIHIKFLDHAYIGAINNARMDGWVIIRHMSKVGQEFRFLFILEA
jgi:hypothetical protein